jgi:hypothetical protein
MNSSENTTRQPANDLLEALLRHASPRARPPGAAEQAARAALHAQWREMTGQRRRRRVYWPLAAAASLALALGVAALLLRSPEPALQPVTVATVEVVVGTVLREMPDGTAAEVVAESLQLRSGSGIATRSDSGLAMRWRDGSSVRLDQDTRVRLTAAGEIHLESGRLYVDAEEGRQAAPPVVVTPAGRVRHLGTQYMTAVGAAGTTVSVRRGRVRLDGPVASAEADAGEQLRVDASGSTSRQAIPAWGDLWQWTQATAPAFPADGRTVANFLDWVSRESGRSITYASPQAERVAQQTELRGRIDLEPMTALAAILQTSDLGYEVRDGSLLIRPLGER